MTSAGPDFCLDGNFFGVKIDSMVFSGAEAGTEDVTDMGRCMEKNEAT